jgi:predicted porin
LSFLNVVAIGQQYPAGFPLYDSKFILPAERFWLNSNNFQLWRLVRGQAPNLFFSTLENFSMKKTLIALAAVAVSSAAMAQVTVYGIVDTGYEWNKAESAAGATVLKSAGLKSGTTAGSRIGFRGVEDLEGGMKAGFVLEAGIQTTDGALTLNGSSGTGFSRTSIAYLDGGFGRLAIGRQFTPTYVAITGLDAGGQALGHTTANLDISGNRNQGITYTSPNIMGVTANLAILSGKLDNATATAADREVKSTDLSLTYAAGPLMAAVAVVNSNTNVLATVAAVNPTGATAGTAASTAGRVKLDGTVIGATYDLGMAKVFASMNKTKTDTRGTVTKQEETNVGVNVPMGKVTLIAAYGSNKDTLSNVAKKSNDYTVGANYAMSKRTLAFVRMSEREFSDNNAPAATGAAIAAANRGGNLATTTVGLRHNF